MAIKSIFAPLSAGTASAGTIDLACRVARRFSAHLEGFHVAADARAVFAATGDGFGAVPPGALLETLLEEGRVKAAEAKALFESAVQNHGIAVVSTPSRNPDHPQAVWREETGYAPISVARRARFFDLVVLGRSDRVIGEPYTDTIEETLARSGRPVLLAPAQAPEGIGYVVAVAWNGSPEAVRAIAASLPWLERANTVWLMTAGTAEEGSAAVVEYLRWHGIEAHSRNVTGPTGRHVGQVLLDTAAEVGADLLVMGGYGHAPWREWLFGGATRDALGASAIPLLLMH